MQNKMIVENLVNSPYLFKYNESYNIKINGIELNSINDISLCTNLVIECGGKNIYNMPFSLYTKMSRTEKNTLYFPVPGNLFEMIPTSSLKHNQVFFILKSKSEDNIHYKLHYTLIPACHGNSYAKYLIEEYYNLPLKSTSTINIPHFENRKRSHGLYVESSEQMDGLTIDMGNGLYVKKYDTMMLKEKIIEHGGDGYLYYLPVDDIYSQLYFIRTPSQDELSVLNSITIDFNNSTTGMAYPAYYNNLLICNGVGYLEDPDVMSL